jgi:Tfp pilus assembly protein PilZ
VTLDGLYKEFVRNIGASGIFIETSVPFQFGRPITITFSPPNQDQPLEITGKVVRRIPEGIGIKFTTMPDKDLQEMIESL